MMSPPGGTSYPHAPAPPSASAQPEHAKRCRWRVLHSEAAIGIIDQRHLQGAGAETRQAVPVLSIERRTGRAAEGHRTVADTITWCLKGARSGTSPSAPPGRGSRLQRLEPCAPAAPRPQERGVSPVPSAGIRELYAFAILGVLATEAGSGLLIVTDAECVCEIEGQIVYEVTGVERLPLAAASGSTASSSTTAADAGGGGGHLLDGALRLLRGKGFYFSQDFEITHTLQWKKRQILEARRTGKDPVPRLPDGSPNLMEAAEQRFVWNRRLVAQLTNQGVSERWFVPLMQGHVQVVQCREPHPEAPGWAVQLKLLLISRRGSGRAGTRYNARGLDDNGEVGNYIETEQLAHLRLVKMSEKAGPVPEGCPQGWLSLVQLRGSVPLFWEQSPQGPLELTREPELASTAFLRHQRATEEAYGGHVFYVNLLSQSAPMEQQLTEALEHQLSEVETSDAGGEGGDRPKKLYCHFDFHARVHGSSQAEFDMELEEVIEELAPFLESCGWLDATADSPFTLAASGPRRWQAGVLRTSCLDCLDRTNVVQFFVTWSWLRAFCQKYRALHGLMEPKQLLGMQETTFAAFQQAGVSLLDSAATWQANLQKAGSSLLGGIFGGGAASRESPAGGDMLEPGGPERTIPPLLRQLLQELWAEQGDRVSQQYTGTDSSTSTMLRQGRCTSYAMLERSWQGLNRAYQASFQDSWRQECIDLLLGHHRACKDLFALSSPSSPAWGRRGPGAPAAGASDGSTRTSRRSPIGSLNVWVGSWNMQGKEQPWDQDPMATPGLEPWLTGAEELPDVAVFCLQELIELSATNVMLYSQGDELRAARFEAAARVALQRSSGAARGSTPAFVKVRSIAMVGLFCIVFVKKSMAGLVRDVRVARVKSGVYGSGNKGTVAVRFELLSTSLCFLCVHFESGESKVEQRTAQLRDALRCFEGLSPPIPAAIDHDVFAIAGDLNVRLRLPAASAELESKRLLQALQGCWAAGWMAKKREDADGGSNGSPPWQPWLGYDQFISGAAQHLRPLGILEGPVMFAPTYRMFVNSDEYDPARTPAWCDRVLYKSVGMRLISYKAVGELRGSDHRPVYATLQATMLGTTDDRLALEAQSREGIPRQSSQPLLLGFGDPEEDSSRGGGAACRPASEPPPPEGRASAAERKGNLGHAFFGHSQDLPPGPRSADPGTPTNDAAVAAIAAAAVDMATSADAGTAGASGASLLD